MCHGSEVGLLSRALEHGAQIVEPTTNSSCSGAAVSNDDGSVVAVALEECHEHRDPTPPLASATIWTMLTIESIPAVVS